MKLKYVLSLTALSLAAASAHASEFVCKVYCANGTTSVVIQADSRSDAAKKIDPEPVANQICRNAGKGNASSSTMGSSQCSAK